MRPLQAQQEVSTKSQLFNSLKVYLKNKDRLQPIIGLDSITECVKAGTQHNEMFYLCEVCGCRLSKADTRNHIMGSLHRYNYIKAQHPRLVSEWEEESDLSKLAWPLMDMARLLESEEGPGQVQWLEVDETVYQKMATHSENAAVTLIRILKDGQRRGEPAGFLDSYQGTEPLIGLFRVVECRSEEGHTYCFLCHCCRIRSNKEDIIDHLTKSSHLVNYLMETHPAKVGVMIADIDANYSLLRSLAKGVEQEEGRGELKVVNAPGYLCSLMNGKSYHWCIKMLFNGWAHTDIRKRKIAVEGPSESETSDGVMPKKGAGLLSQWPKTLAPQRKGTNTVFNIRLPLAKGSVLLERSSFNTDSPAGSPTYSPDWDVHPAPESQYEDCDLDYDAESFDVDPNQLTSRPQRDLRGGEAEAGQYMGPESNFEFPPYGDMDGYHRDNAYCNQAEDFSVSKYQKVNGEDNLTGQHGYQGTSGGPWTEWLSPAVPYAQASSPCNYYWGREASHAEYDSTSRSNVGTTDVSQRHCYQQRPSATQGHGGFPTEHAVPQCPSGESAAHSDAAWFSVPPRGGAPHPAVQLLELEQRSFPKYMGGHYWS